MSVPGAVWHRLQLPLLLLFGVPTNGVAQPPSAGSTGFLSQKMATSVDTVPFPKFCSHENCRCSRCGATLNKDALIELTVKYNCEFVALPLPVIRNRNQSSSQLAAAAVSAAPGENIEEGGVAPYEI